jgi:hypothetical protein
MAAIPFTGNYQDLSTDRGYQFKFYCEKCNNGYMSTFQTSAVGMIGSAARAASSLFGGFLGNVANSTYEVQRAIASGSRFGAKRSGRGDRADLQAMHTVRTLGVRTRVLEQEGRPLRSLCARSRRRTGSGPATAAREQIQEKAREVDWSKSRNIEQVTGAVCPSCGVKTQGGKFCQECGATLQPKKKMCRMWSRSRRIAESSVRIADKSTSVLS